MSRLHDVSFFDEHGALVDVKPWDEESEGVVEITKVIMGPSWAVRPPCPRPKFQLLKMDK